MIEKWQMPIIKVASLWPLRGAAGDQVHLLMTGICPFLNIYKLIVESSPAKG
jgi:hypothetical protein